MSVTSGIEWTDATWNPVTGCTKVSPGCAHCYAETWAERHMGEFAKDRARPFSDVRCHEEKLGLPRRWKKPRRIFVNSMSDLFHEDVPDDFILEVYRRMGAAHWHTYQVLTKRAQRMHDLMPWLDERLRADGRVGLAYWRHVWHGVSVENQARADERVPLLLQTAVAHRFLSCEPLLGEVLLPHWLSATNTYAPARVEWVIVGGESGPRARPCEIEWILSIVVECRSVRIPLFVKQVGRHPVMRDVTPEFSGYDAIWAYRAIEMEWPIGTRFRNRTGDVRLNGRVALLKDAKGGDPSEWPADLRVREYP